jgi:osmoprotectant transport system substrate-binding protein
MPRLRRIALFATIALLSAVALVAGLAACGGSSPPTAAGTTSAKTTTLPGTNKPPITIGDKNTTEQFVLGELYSMALQAEGFTVTLNQNIGPTEVTLQALANGQLDMYPEYLDTWNSAIAGYTRNFASQYVAYQAAQRYALPHGMELLNPTPFSDTDAIAVGFNYGAENNLNTIGDLRKVAQTLTLGGPPQFQQNANGLPAIEQAYGFMPAAFKALDLGEQYTAIDQGTVEAADVNTTDGELISGNYTVLRDPKHVFGWGNAVPVVTTKVVDAEGPAFTETVNKVSALLTTSVMRQLNAAVDLSHETPQAAAKQFLISRGLLPAQS